MRNYPGHTFFSIHALVQTSFFAEASWFFFSLVIFANNLFRHFSLCKQFFLYFSSPLPLQKNNGLSLSLLLLIGSEY